MEHRHNKTIPIEPKVHPHESAQGGHTPEHPMRPTDEGMNRGMPGMDHGGHDKHAGHSPEMFRNRFFVSLVLTLPILYYEHLFQQWFRYRAVQFPGSAWITPVLAVVIFFYGGWPFVEGGRRELAARQPGVMTLVALAISVSFTFSIAVSLRLPGMPFYW